MLLLSASLGGSVLSENVAARAACGAKTLLDLVLKDGAPLEDDTEDISLLRVVGCRDKMAFLATAHVDFTKSLAGADVGVVIADDLHVVDTADREGTVCLRLTEESWVLAASVSNDCVNEAGSVGVRILVERNADQLVRRDVGVQELESHVSEGVPVSVFAGDHLRLLTFVALLHGVPKGLAARITDVLRSARDGENVDMATLLAECVSFVEKLTPAVLVVEGLELEIVERALTGEDGALAVEESEYVVALLNVSLVASDRDDLTPAQFLALNKLLKLATICKRVSRDHLPDISLSGRPCLASHARHFNI